MKTASLSLPISVVLFFACSYNMGCATYRTKQFKAVSEDSRLESWKVKPNVYAFVGTRKYSGEEAQDIKTFYVRFDFYAQDVFDIVIDSVFVGFPSHKREQVLEQNGEESLVTSKTEPRYGKIVIPNEIKRIVLRFRARISETEDSPHAAEHLFEMDMRRDESSHLFFSFLD